jgi:trigger factor
MALVEGCKHSLEITVPVSEVEQETNRVIESIREKARMPGFRPGKVPPGMIRSKFPEEIRKGVIEALVPKHLRDAVKKENLNMAGEPALKEVHFKSGEPLRVRVELEVYPEFELGDYRGMTVTYREPVVTEEDVDKRIEALRERKAEYINIDPRPAAEGDYAVVSLESMAGLEGKPIRQEEMTLRIGDPETLPDFSNKLTGMEPGEEAELEVTYPEDYAEPRLGGKTVKFHMRLKTIRRKELPEVNDEFAKDLGDYQNVDELRDAVRKGLMGEREVLAREQAKAELVDRVVEMHDFPVPEVAVERQLEGMLEQRARELAIQGVDPRTLQFDWAKFKEIEGARARRDVKAYLILERIAEREAIETMMEDLDREVQRIARQRGEPVPAVRKRLEKEGHMRVIANRIRHDKTINLLFEQARKVAPQDSAE